VSLIYIMKEYIKNGKKNYYNNYNTAAYDLL
jgi:hypothetical protein